jgi:hypothetical protein
MTATIMPVGISEGCTITLATVSAADTRNAPVKAQAGRRIL